MWHLINLQVLEPTSRVLIESGVTFTPRFEAKQAFEGTFQRDENTLKCKLREIVITLCLPVHEVESRSPRSLCRGVGVANP